MASIWKARNTSVGEDVEKREILCVLVQFFFFFLIYVSLLLTGNSTEGISLKIYISNPS